MKLVTSGPALRTPGGAVRISEFRTGEVRYEWTRAAYAHRAANQLWSVLASDRHACREKRHTPCEVLL